MRSEQFSSPESKPLFPFRVTEMMMIMRMKMNRWNDRSMHGNPNLARWEQ